MSETDSRSIPEIISAMTGDLATLVRKESELVRTEVSEKISEAARAGVSMSIGAALLLGGFLCLMAALVLALSHVMDPAWAALLVGVVAGLVGYTLLRGAAKKVQPSALAPDRAARQIRKDAQLMKEQVR
ncbi:phage holin family protein [Phenylobacterium sp. LjRoot219]|uniref:phage holin family protein n=1 Tax=Phenylobacterium sp. LjRoot219 TaxID=3342283 RepID=UPI003ED11ABC